MRRTALVLIGVVTVAALAAAFTPRSSADSDYRVDVIFDTAKGIVPGQLVKIAGVRAGSVEDVRLTSDQKARLSLAVDGEFGPFRAGARCRILPQGLISENFVECDPGSSGRPLRAAASGVPTVPVERTTVPVSLQDVVDIFSLPVSERVSVLINELGLATAGRGDDLNAILRRANPTLADVERALAILGGQRRTIADAIDQTDAVLASLQKRRNAVRGFVRNASRVTATTAATSKELGAAVRDLPPMFSAVDRGLASLRKISRTGTPLLRDLRAAAPRLTTFTREIVPFARAGRPALRTVGTVAGARLADVRAATPVFKVLRRFVQDLELPAGQTALLFDSLTKQGGVETVMKFFYQMAAMSGGYDRISHFVGVVINVWVPCLLNVQRVGCSQAYSAPGNGTIPANAPSVGPQRLGTVLPTGAPVLRNDDFTRIAKENPDRVAALLDYLLK